MTGITGHVPTTVIALDHRWDKQGKMPLPLDKIEDGYQNRSAQMAHNSWICLASAHNKSVILITGKHHTEA